MKGNQEESETEQGKKQEQSTMINNNKSSSGSGNNNKSDVEYINLVSESTFIERSLGFLTASIFSLVYLFAPIYTFTAPLAFYFFFVSSKSNDFSFIYGFVYFLPLVLTLSFPSRKNNFVLHSYPVKCIPKYFNYSEVLEYSDEEVVNYTSKRSVCLAQCPHGVISYTGICSAIVSDSDYNLPLRQKVLHNFPTAAASIVLKFPLLKHVIGIFGLIDASKKNLLKHISKGKSFVLYPGGIAELFLSSPTEEVILCRKGFIKLALTTGSDIMPVYLFGNTSVLQVFTHPLLVKISRSLGASLTLFWGRWGLPLPMNDKLIYVRGKPLNLPSTPNENPSQEDIDKWHTKYIDEMKRLFDTYKYLREDYRDKVLRVQEDEKVKKTA